MNKGNIIIVGDNTEGNDALRNKLKSAHYHVEQIASADRVLKTLHKGMVDLVIADFQRQPEDCLGFLNRIRALNNKPPVIITADQPNVEEAVAAIKAGASDYLADPENSEQLLSILEKVLQPLPAPRFMPIAVSVTSRATLQMAEQVAKADATVLITGESGTGKEVLARYIHSQSNRSTGPFVGINCAAIPENLLESELFGHNKGAFTGALTQQTGRFEQANKGTLLLDEIAELPASLQAKLLRVLQEKEVERLGSRTRIKLDVRVLAATNRDLQEQVRLGLFREDLYYRLNVFPLSWAPLRDRIEDIIPLAEHFLSRLSTDATIELSGATCEKLKAYHWPGNVRELENVIQRALVMKEGNIIRPENLMLDVQSIHSQDPSLSQPAELIEQTDDISLESKRKQEEFKHIISTLRQHKGHRGKTAEALGVTTRTLRNKVAEMRKAGLDIEQILSNPTEMERH